MKHDSCFQKNAYLVLARDLNPNFVHKVLLLDMRSSCFSRIPDPYKKIATKQN